VQVDGQRDVLGLWIEQTEGVKFWLKVFNDLKTRGCQDFLIAVVDGLKGLAEAINTAYPKTTVQTCIVHLIRSSLDYAGWKDRKLVAQALRPIYTAVSEQAAEDALQEFANGPPGAARYPSIVQAWKRAWERVIPFFVFPPDIRRVIYTTNAIESLNMQLRKIIETHGHFPNDESAIKLLWLALRHVLNKAVRRSFDWKSTMNQFAILYGDRSIRAMG
jgi:transposase-like protein